MDEGGYIQGAADDTENWAHGLTAPLFWDNLAQLLEASEAELPDMIASLVSEEEAIKMDQGARKDLTKYISVCPLPLAAADDSNECRIAITSETTPKNSWIKSKTYMQVGLGKSKAASRNLRSALPDICNFVSAFLSAHGESSKARIVIACDSGKDLSVATALAINCYLFDTEGVFREPVADTLFTKSLIKARLGAIMTVYPDANPNRASLQSVNSFLMDWQR